jgi:hypothetical protein
MECITATEGHYRKEVAMCKIKETTRSILPIMPAEGWVVVFQDEDGELSETVRTPLFAWALVRVIAKKTAHTQVTGLPMDDEGQIRESCWSEGFLRYERREITERPQSSGK